MNYRKEIDGLRAISILPVIFFHFGYPAFSGGYIGVDIFFVISGYLITTFIIKENDRKNFSLIKFYERRARRILPLLLIVLLITTSISYFLFTPTYLDFYYKSVLAALFFYSNFFFWNKSGYFETGSDINPIFHTWSLSIEEQYYLIFPLVFLFFIKIFGKKIITLLSATILIGACLSHYLSMFHPSANFYLLPFRIFQISIGVLTAILLNYYKFSKFNIFTKNIFSLFGLFLIIISIFLFNEDTLSPSLFSLIPLVGCSLVILFTNERTYIFKILTNKILVFVGLLSYGLYLWHIPILTFYKINYSINDIFDYIIILLLTFLITLITWKYVEKPFRNFELIKSKLFFNILLVFLILFLGLIFTLIFNSGKRISNFEKNLDPENKKIFLETSKATKTAGYESMYDDGNCKFWSKNLDDDFLNRFENCKNKANQKAIIMLGDSHQMDLYNGISKTSDKKFIASISRGRCRLHTPNPLGYQGCQFSEIKDFLEKNSKEISTLIYHQSGSFFLSGSKNLPIKTKHIMETINYLLTFTDIENVIWIGPRIEPNIMMDFTFTKNYKKHKKFVNYNIKYVDEQITKKTFNSNIKYISLIKAINFEFNKDFNVDGKFTYSDYDHWSEFGEFYFTEKILAYSKLLRKVF
tara:strand:+ start:115 stop:2037 length:1923 start_codon:yes stop_codon:yes gene_type:complete